MAVCRAVWFRAILAQACGAIVALLALKTAASIGFSPASGVFIAIDSGSAMLMSLAFTLPVWWLPIQGLFVPTLLWALSFNWPSGVFLAAFILLWLVFRSSPQQRVPLYLSNKPTWRVLANLLPERSGFAFLDLGCGLGGTLDFLAGQRTDGVFHGVESAPAPFLVSWLRLMRKPNAYVRFGDMWREDLGRYDVVYAYLSPSPMPDLWRKAQAEMRAGALLISNSFEIPGVAPVKTLMVDDPRNTRLFIWRMGDVMIRKGKDGRR